MSIWFALVAFAIYMFLFDRNLIQSEFQRAFYFSLLLGGGVYLLAGCLRGFTLIPSTYLVFVGLPLFPPRPLFLLTIIGILVSSASIYLFSESLHLGQHFEGRHKHRVMKVRAILQKNELPVIIGWSFFPFAPTDLICYVCGILEIDFWKFLFGVMVGEGAICGIYIFFGNHVLRFLHLLPWK
ncbi:MAG TPA: VTT domain-containing protein [Candidatus Acidoferrales bacterium]|nr:VTT domain-containing protein [Candidatus Acidoferrales bacterium]